MRTTSFGIVAENSRHCLEIGVFTADGNAAANTQTALKMEGYSRLLRKPIFRIDVRKCKILGATFHSGLRGTVAVIHATFSQLFCEPKPDDVIDVGVAGARIGGENET